MAAKAEGLPGPRDADPRFVVAGLGRDRIGTSARYGEPCCARNGMENGIREQQLDLFADRASTATMRANQSRGRFSSFAYTLMVAIRQFGPAGARMAAAQCGTIRARLFRVADAIRRACALRASAWPPRS